jgi:peptide chain release factor subunit 1
MISREELKKLAEVESPKGCAISFYYQPETPQDVSHRREALQVKELVRDAQRRFERNGVGNHVRADLERILIMAEQLQGNGDRARVVFACADQDIWREWDLPANFDRTRLFVNSRFHLGPLAAAVLSEKPVCVVLADREHFRIFDYSAGELREIEHVIDDIPRKVRTDGFGGYNAGHMERHVDNEAMRHFKKLAARLQEIRGPFECFAFGIRADTWPEIEPHLHSYVKQRLIGTFVVDPVLASAEEIRSNVDRLLSEHSRAEQDGIVREAIGEAQRNGRGSLGLRHVITSLERGEVQSLLIGRNFEAKAVECKNCGHLDTRLVEKCAVCTQETRELDNVIDALVGRALTSGYEIRFIEDDPDFEKAGGIGALLRFRADQNTPEKLAM